jgi:flagellar basal-body rod protein FlgF
MDKMLYLATANSLQNIQALSINANNIACTESIGFKADLSLISTMKTFGEVLINHVCMITGMKRQKFDGTSLSTTGRDLDLIYKSSRLKVTHVNDELISVMFKG